MKELKTKQKYTTTFLERGSFWFFGIGMLFYYQIVGSYLNTYLLLRGVDLGKVALIFLGIKIWDAVNDPLFAFIFDRVKFKKEKCLPWLRIAAIIMPLASIAVFNMPANWSETGKLIWFAVTYMLWDAAYTVCDVPFFSMTTTMTVNMDERNTLFSVARVFHGAGTLLCTTAMTWLVGENVGMNFGLASIIVCGIGALFTIPLCFLGKERYAIPPKQEDQEAHKFSLKEMLSYLKQNKYLTMMYGCQILCGICATGGAAGMVGTYYLYGQTSFGIITTWLNMIPGRVVLSTQGRDEGRYFIVLEVIDEQFVLMADGLTRKVDHPKKKKVKHLRPKPIVVNVDGSTLPNKHLQDSDLRRYLRENGLEISNPSTDVDDDK